MALEYILGNALAAVDGALGILFLDETGEAVEVASAKLAPDDLRALGAYVGIHLRGFDRILGELGSGQTEMVHFTTPTVHVFAQVLPESYYLVLLQEAPSLTALARRTLATTARELIAELFPEKPESVSRPGPTADPR